MKKQTATIPWEVVLPTFELMTMDWQIMFHYIQVGLFSRLNAISLVETWFWNIFWHVSAVAAAAKSLQSCPTLCDPIDSSPPGSPIPGILQARTLEWVAISFSNAWDWSRSIVSNSSWSHGPQPTRLLRPWDVPDKSTGVGCHCLLLGMYLGSIYCSEYFHET